MSIVTSSQYPSPTNNYGAIEKVEEPLIHQVMKGLLMNVERLDDEVRNLSERLEFVMKPRSPETGANPIPPVPPSSPICLRLLELDTRVDDTLHRLSEIRLRLEI